MKLHIYITLHKNKIFLIKTIYNMRCFRAVFLFLHFFFILSFEFFMLFFFNKTYTFKTVTETMQFSLKIGIIKLDVVSF